MLIIPVLEPLKMKCIILAAFLALAFSGVRLAQKAPRVPDNVAQTLWFYLKGLEVAPQPEK